MSDRALTGADRCWPCTVANTAVGLVVGWLPLAAAVIGDRSGLYLGTTAWGLLVTGYTVYRLFAMGYLPFAEAAARRTGLHGRIGPGEAEEPGIEGAGNPSRRDEDR